MSRRRGFIKKDKFYRKGTFRVHPLTLLERYFEGKTDVKHVKDGRYHFYYWKDKQYATDGDVITVKYQEKYERPSFETYLECLSDAKQYLAKKYDDSQLSIEDFLKVMP